MQQSKNAFTLIEMSIVLVIIGLIVSGILVGRDLISAAEVRGQISQIEQINVGYTTFKLKYDALPGDMYANAPKFGLLQGFNYTGRDNSVITDSWMPSNVYLHNVFYGEPAFFWGHLIQAGLIPASFATRDGLGNPCTLYPDGGSPANTPPGGYYTLKINPRAAMIPATIDGNNYLYLGITRCDLGFINGVDGTTMSPVQLYGIDKKTDDGMPSTGHVLATGWHGGGSLDLTLDTDNTADNCIIPGTVATYDVTRRTMECKPLVRLR